MAAQQEQAKRKRQLSANIADDKRLARQEALAKRDALTSAQLQEDIRAISAINPHDPCLKQMRRAEFTARLREESQA